LTATGRGKDGLPTAPGVWSRGGHTVIRLGPAGPAEGAAIGSTITITFSDGTAKRHTVRGVEQTGTPQAAELVGSASGLVVLAPAGEGRWTVLTAR
jgi:hypothetical protein